MLNLDSIPAKMHKDVIGSYWIMLRELESTAENNNDRFLMHQVEGFYRQWNEMTGDLSRPVGIRSNQDALYVLRK